MRRLRAWCVERWPLLVIVAVWLVFAAMLVDSYGAFMLLPFIVVGPPIGWIWCAHTERLKMRADFDAADRYARACAQRHRL